MIDKHELQAIRGLATSVAAKETPTSKRLAACILRLLREVDPSGQGEAPEPPKVVEPAGPIGVGDLVEVIEDKSDGDEPYYVGPEPWTARVVELYKKDGSEILVEPDPALPESRTKHRRMPLSSHDKVRVLKKAERPVADAPILSLPLTGLMCADCGEPQHQTPGGPCCKNGHGGAEGVEPSQATAPIASMLTWRDRWAEIGVELHALLMANGGKHQIYKPVVRIEIYEHDDEVTVEVGRCKGMDEVVIKKGALGGEAYAAALLRLLKEARAEAEKPAPKPVQGPVNPGAYRKDDGAYWKEGR